MIEGIPIAACIAKLISVHCSKICGVRLFEYPVTHAYKHSMQGIVTLSMVDCNVFLLMIDAIIVCVHVK